MRMLVQVGIRTVPKEKDSHMRSAMAAILILLAVVALRLGASCVEQGYYREAAGFLRIGFLGLGAGLVALISALDRSRFSIDRKTRQITRHHVH